MIETTHTFELCSKKYQKQVAKFIRDKVAIIKNLATIVFVVQDKNGELQYREERMEQGDKELVSSNDPKYDFYLDLSNATYKDVYIELGIIPAPKPPQKPVKEIFKVKEIPNGGLDVIISDDLFYEVNSFETALDRLSELEAPIKFLTIIEEFNDTYHDDSNIAREFYRIIFECEHLKNVTYLKIRSHHMDEIPKEILNLSQLEILKINMWKLVETGDLLKGLENLQKIDIEGCRNLKIVSANNVKELHIKKTENLSISREMPNLLYINAYRCGGLDLTNAAFLPSLKVIETKHTTTKALPTMKTLKVLEMDGNDGINDLPSMPSIEKIKITRNGGSLERLSNASTYTNILDFKVVGTFDEFPSEILGFKNLESFELTGDGKLIDLKIKKPITSSLEHLKLNSVLLNGNGFFINELKSILIDYCSVKKWPLAEDATVEKINLWHSTFKNIPSLDGITGLKYLKITACGWDKMPKMDVEFIESFEFYK